MTWICTNLFTRKCFALLFLTSSLMAEEGIFHPAVKGGFDVWIDFDVLYWKPREKALVPTNQMSSVYVTSDFTQTSLVHPHFQWDPGYRLNCGYIFSKDRMWDIKGSVLHYASSVFNQKDSHSSFVGMFPIWSLSNDIISGDYVFNSKLRWTFNLNMADLQIGRCVSFTNLELEPFFGLRSLWLRQHGHIIYQGGIFLIGITAPEVTIYGTDSIKMKNYYWGMGPRIGMQGLLHIKRKVGLSAMAAVAAPYGFFHVQQKETYLDTVRFFDQKHIDRFGWVGDFSGGIFWKIPCAHDRYAFTIQTDWEYHLFLHQLVLKGDAFGLVPKNRDFSTKGLTFSMRFDF